MGPKRTVPVQLLGKEYRIRSDADPDTIRRAAALVDETVRKVRDRTTTVDTIDVAVLAALNLANHLVALRESNGATGVIATPAGGQTTRFTTRIPPVENLELLPLLQKQGVEIKAEPAEDVAGAWWVTLLPWILIIGFWFFLWRRMAGGLPGGLGRGGSDLKDFLRGGVRKVEGETAPKVTFDDVAGQDNAKREVAELLEFLRDPDKYNRLGAEVPHGILLEGPPGTGKTLMAKALAGEAGVPFFQISASEFIEVFVGVGASRGCGICSRRPRKVRRVSYLSTNSTASGGCAATGLGGGHDEREQTLNQILAEMDGFEGHEAVVVLAATNRPDVLDPALLRPGRFDRHITLELPDRDARVAILKVHTKHVPLTADVDLDKDRRRYARILGRRYQKPGQ